jgi:hypothetical protein
MLPEILLYYCSFPEVGTRSCINVIDVMFHMEESKAGLAGSYLHASVFTLWCLAQQGKHEL